MENFDFHLRDSDEIDVGLGTGFTTVHVVVKHKGVTEQSLIGNNADMKFYFRRFGMYRNERGWECVWWDICGGCVA